MLVHLHIEFPGSPGSGFLSGVRFLYFRWSYQKTCCQIFSGMNIFCLMRGHSLKRIFRLVSYTKEFTDFMTVTKFDNVTLSRQQILANFKLIFEISKKSKNFSLTWDLFHKRNKNLNKYFVKISILTSSITNIKWPLVIYLPQIRSKLEARIMDIQNFLSMEESTLLQQPLRD